MERNKMEDHAFPLKQFVSVLFEVAQSESA